MKTNTQILAGLAGLLAATAAQAQVELTVTGATAFRAITIDRAHAIFDPGYTAYTNNATTGRITIRGTMATAVPALGSTLVTARLSFSGSTQGMLDVLNQVQIATANIDAGTGTINNPADCAFSDAFPASATPPIPESTFTREIVGVVPMVFARNNALTGVNNITKDQANLFFTSSGDFGMPASYLGGASVNPVYLIGRDSGSGTRVVMEKCTGFSGSPLLWATNGAGNYVITNGYSSGGLVRGVIANKPDAIGYLSLGDYISISNSATLVSYNGVPFSPANVENGAYSIWGYQHLVHRVGGLSANQQLVFGALKGAITDEHYQTNAAPGALYSPNFVSVGKMKVQRGADGGVITSTEF